MSNEKDLIQRVFQLKKELKIAVSALKEAATSLETLSRSGATNGASTLVDVVDIRGFASSRSRVARQAVERLHTLATGRQ